MKCPFCGEEMTKGMLGPSRDGAFAYWISEAYEKKNPFPPYTKKGFQESGAVKIFTGFGLTCKADPFWLCRSCGKLVGEIRIPETEPSHGR